MAASWAASCAALEMEQPAKRDVRTVPFSADFMPVILEDVGAHQLIMQSDGCICNV